MTRHGARTATQRIEIEMKSHINIVSTSESYLLFNISFSLSSIN